LPLSGNDVINIGSGTLAAASKTTDGNDFIIGFVGVKQSFNQATGMISLP
jgi:hypothetical protein